MGAGTDVSVRHLLESTTQAWVDDADSDVVWCGEHDGRWGIRMKQTVRDFTTIWFDVGERTLGYEAYVIPAPASNREEVYRQLLVRNRRRWRVHFAIDAEGGVYLRGRAPVELVDAGELDAIVGAVYDAVEEAFGALLLAGFEREKNR
jgi:hypothetical protein